MAGLARFFIKRRRRPRVRPIRGRLRTGAAGMVHCIAVRQRLMAMMAISRRSRTLRALRRGPHSRTAYCRSADDRSVCRGRSRQPKSNGPSRAGNAKQSPHHPFIGRTRSLRNQLRRAHGKFVQNFRPANSNHAAHLSARGQKMSSICPYCSRSKRNCLTNLETPIT